MTVKAIPVEAAKSRMGTRFSLVQECVIILETRRRSHREAPGNHLSILLAVHLSGRRKGLERSRGFPDGGIVA
jgi:hypothetical protein